MMREREEEQGAFQIEEDDNKDMEQTEIRLMQQYLPNLAYNVLVTVGSINQLHAIRPRAGIFLPRQPCHQM